MIDVAKRLNILSISDIHFGHRQTPTPLIIDNVMRVFAERLPCTQLLVIGGDVFDTLLSLTETNVNDILQFFQWLLAQCHQYDVVVRVLAGTHSHDRTQCSVFQHLHHEHLFRNDLRYIDTVRLEYIEPLGLRMLYLPDDLPYESSEAVLRVVAEQMHDLGWDYVDYAVLHGWLEKALPAHVPINKRPTVVFRTEQLRFVRRWVMAGHIHTPMVSDHTFYNGSFDRLCHGEEEPKGCMWIEQAADGSTKLEFIENTNAAIYRTIDLTPYADIDQALAVFTTELARLPYHPVTHVRTIHPQPEVRTALQRFCATHQPHIRYTHQSPKSQTDDTDEGESFDPTILTAPTLETLPTLVLEYLNGRNTPHDLTAERVAALFT